MKRWLYNVFFLAGFVLAAPYYFWRLWRRGNWLNGFTQRFARYDKNLRQAITNRHIVWVHAVSVGEVNVCAEFVRALQSRIPNAKIIVSTTTTTGMAELQKKLPATFGRIYYPIDRAKYVEWAYRTLHPSAVILIEAEIWPNFVWRAIDSGTPLFLVNGRLSRRSFPRYKRFGFLFRELFGAFTGVGAQTEEYAQQFKQLGCSADAVHVTGNLKFDAARSAPAKTLDVPKLLAQVGVPEGALILVAGSTHSGEEEILCDQFLRLRREFPNLYLILVPRHFERAREVGRSLSKRLKLFNRSAITAETNLAARSTDCLLVDTTGELVHFYKQATVVFVGKSLTAIGGQNPLEPAGLGKPVVFGPNMQNFADIARTLVADGGAIQAADASGVEKAIHDLLADPARRRKLGEAAEAVVKKNQGAISRTIELILPHLAAQDLYVAPVKNGSAEPANGASMIRQQAAAV